MSHATRSLLLSLALAAALHGQEVTASLSGTVLDQSGAVVPGAALVATNVSTGTSQSATSSSSGNYVIPLLRPGQYKLTATSTGFKAWEASGITLEIGQRAQLNVTLEVGATTERMDVVAEAPVISTESSSTGKVIDHQTITQMPLNGRLNITGLLALAPGVQNAGNQDGLPGGIEPDAGGVTSTQGVAFTLDGSSNQSSWLERGFAEFPPLDGIQEFKVLTSLAPAEYGKAVQVSVVSKSGGNEVHGMLVAGNPTMRASDGGRHLPKRRPCRLPIFGRAISPDCPPSTILSTEATRSRTTSFRPTALTRRQSAFRSFIRCRTGRGQAREASGTT